MLALESIQSQARKMSALTAQLLTLARADRGQDNMVRETVELSNLAEMVSLQMEETAQKKTIYLSKMTGSPTKYRLFFRTNSSNQFIIAAIPSNLFFTELRRNQR